MILQKELYTAILTRGHDFSKGNTDYFIFGL